MKSSLLLTLCCIAIVSSVHADGVRRALLRSASQGELRLLSNVQQANTMLRSIGSHRSTQVVSSDCAGHANEACCPIQTDLVTLAASSAACANLATVDVLLSFPVLAPAEVSGFCQGSCFNSAQRIFIDMNNVTNVRGCASVAALRVFLDVSCMTDPDTDDYCYDTVRALLTDKENGVNSTATLTQHMCTPCGRKVLNHLFQLSLLEKKVLDLDAFLPVVREALPFICDRDPDDDKQCLSNPDKDDDLKNPCSYCGRSAARYGALGGDLGLPADIEPILNCGCGDRDNTRSCIHNFNDKNISYSGTGSRYAQCNFTSECLVQEPCILPDNMTGLCNVTTTCNHVAACSSDTGGTPIPAPDGVDKDDFTPCLALMSGATTTCSAECAEHLTHLADDVGCCMDCLLIGFNYSVASGALPTHHEILQNIGTRCNGFDVDSLAPCDETRYLEHNITVNNLRYSWCKSTDQNFETVKYYIKQAVSKAAGTPESELYMYNVEGVNGGTTFQYYLNVSSETHGEMVTHTLTAFSDRYLIDLSPLEELAFPDLDQSTINKSEPFTTNFTAKSAGGTSGASAIHSMSITVFMLIASAVVALM